MNISIRDTKKSSEGSGSLSLCVKSFDGAAASGVPAFTMHCIVIKMLTMNICLILGQQRLVIVEEISSLVPLFKGYVKDEASCEINISTDVVIYCACVVLCMYLCVFMLFGHILVQCHCSIDMLDGPHNL